MDRGKGFHYTLDREDIINYMKLTTKEKLIWLSEITSFTERVLTVKEKKIRDYFRNYQIRGDNNR